MDSNNENKNKKEERWVVIAIIIILITLGILGASLLNRREITPDEIITQRLNEILDEEELKNNKPETFEEAVALLHEYGYIIPNMNPSSSKNYFAYDLENNAVILIAKETGEIIYPEKIDDSNKANWYVSVATEAEAKNMGDKGYGLFFEQDIDTIYINKVVSVDTSTFNCKSLTMIEETNKSVKVVGHFESVSISSTETAVTQDGIVLDGNYAGKSLNVNGYIEKLNVNKGDIVVEQKGCINKLEAKGSDKKSITNNGKVVCELPNGFEKAGNGIYANETNKTIKYYINSLEELVEFRDQVNVGRDFSYTTVYLNCSVDISGTCWTPIGTKEHPFNGSFDGQNNTIRGLDDTGYVDDAISITEGTENIGSVYGFFGVIGSTNDQALTLTFSNVNFTDVNINAVGANMVGALFGADTASIKVNNNEKDNIVIENVSVAGIINCTNSTGGLVGGIAGKISTYGAVTIKNCTNKADLSAKVEECKVAGIVGYIIQSSNIEIYNCTNEGSITSNYYFAGIALMSFDKKAAMKVTVVGCSNTGKIIYVGNSKNHTTADGAYVLGNVTVPYEKAAKGSAYEFANNTNKANVYTSNSKAITGYVLANVTAKAKEANNTKSK